MDALDFCNKVYVQGDKEATYENLVSQMGLLQIDERKKREMGLNDIKGENPCQ